MGDLSMYLGFLILVVFTIVGNLSKKLPATTQLFLERPLKDDDAIKNSSF